MLVAQARYLLCKLNKNQKSSSFNLKTFLFYLLIFFLKADAFSSPKFKGTSIKTRGKIETIDDEQDPDLIPHYPRLTNIHQEELIELENSDPSFMNRDRHKNAANDFLTDVEINFNGLLMNGKVPESCVWKLLNVGQYPSLCIAG